MLLIGFPAVCKPSNNFLFWKSSRDISDCVSHQKRHFLVSIDLIAPFPLTSLCGVLSNVVLPSGFFLGGEVGGVNHKQR